MCFGMTVLTGRCVVTMSKPKQIFLLEVEYLDGRPYRAPGGGIFRTETDMDVRIATIGYRRRGKPVKLTISRVAGDWEPVREETLS